MKAILTLDLGTHTGFAISKRNKVIASGTKIFKKDKSLSSRIRAFSSWLRETLEIYEKSILSFMKT